MVKITFNELRIDGPLAGQIQDTVINDEAGRYLKELTHYLNGKTCALHPRMNQEMVVNADRVYKYTIEKKQFCCDKFKDSIQFVPSP